jgi:hypothetical protein
MQGIYVHPTSCRSSLIMVVVSVHLLIIPTIAVEVRLGMSKSFLVMDLFRLVKILGQQSLQKDQRMKPT